MRTKRPTPCLHCGGVSAQPDAGGINANCHGYARGVNKHGGDVLTHPVVAVVCWGYYYRQNPAVAAEFGTLVSDLFQSTYWSNLAEYGVGGGRMAGVATCNGDIFDRGTAGPAPQLQSWLSQGLVPHPQTAADARDWAYLIIPPPGEVVHNGDVTSLTGLCGYHGHHQFEFGLDFGDISHDPTWIGDFTRPGRSEVLFYSPTDGAWLLAQWDTDSRQLDWSLVSSTRAAFGNNPMIRPGSATSPRRGAPRCCSTRRATVSGGWLNGMPARISSTGASCRALATARASTSGTPRTTRRGSATSAGRGTRGAALQTARGPVVAGAVECRRGSVRLGGGVEHPRRQRR